MESITEFFTSKTGIFAAIVAVVSLIGAILKITTTLKKEKKERDAEVSDLAVSGVTVEDPPPWSEAAKASFQIMNGQGGKAVMSDLLLIVTDHGESSTPKMVEAAAPVPQYSFKVVLKPDVAEYDVREKEFGSPEPHSYIRGEVESFSIELRSTQPQWYQFHFLVRWYDVARPNEQQSLRTPDLRVEFKPDVEDLLT